MEREQWRREKLTKMNVKTIMTIAVVGSQVPQKTSVIRRIKNETLSRYYLYMN